MNVPAQEFSVLKGQDFVKDVAIEAERAKKIVWGQAMEFEPDEVTLPLVHVFSNAAKRKLHVKLTIDYYSLLATDGTFNYLPLFNKEREEKRKKRLLSRLKMITKLREEYVDVALLNKPTLLEKFLPTKGRNHVKLVIVDDIAWMGGINFHAFNLVCDDFMVKIMHKPTVDFLKQLFTRMHHHEQLQDFSIETREDIHLLIDGGDNGKSIILDHATRLVSKAKKSVWVSSAFYPDGEFLSKLNKAYKRGLDVQVVVPEVKTTHGMTAKIVNTVDETIMNLRGKKIPLLKNKRGMHAKFLVIDGKVGLFGSHNFSERGVAMGTTELAMETTNTTAITNLENFFTYLLTGTK